MFCCKEEQRNKQKLAGKWGQKRGIGVFSFKTGEKQHRTVLLGTTQETGDRRGQRWHLGSGGMGWVSLALGEFENSCSTYRTPGRRSPCCKVGQCEVGICKSSPLTALIFLTEAEAQHEEETK